MKNKAPSAIKWCAIIGAILLGIGLLVILASFLANGLIGFGAGRGREKSYGSDFGPNSVNAVQDLPAEAEITSLDIELSQNALTVKQGDAFSLELSEKAAPYARYYVENGTLYFKDTRSGVNIIEDPLKQYQVTITIPKGQALQSFQLKPGISDVDISFIQVDDMALYGGVGRLNAHDIAVTSRFLLECGVGGSDIRGDLRGELEIHGGVGAIRLTLDGPRSDYAINASTGMGELEIDGNSYNMFGPGLKDDGPAGNSLDITSGVGAIKVRFGG